MFLSIRSYVLPGSPHDTDAQRQEATKVFYQKRLEHYLNNSHSSCVCQPENVYILLNGVSSNSDISTDNNKGLDTLRDCLRRSTGRTTLIVSGPDGLCTNPDGLISFFNEFENLEITLTEVRTAGDIYEYQVKDILGAFNAIASGRAMDSSAFELAHTMIQLGLNKTL